MLEGSSAASLLYRAIKLICSRVIHESENVCPYLNSTLQLTQCETQVRSRHTYISVAKDIRIQING
jgi:hypothetical protein